MEKILKAVTIHRTSFDRLYDETIKLLQSPNYDITDLQGYLKLMELKMETMMELDRQLFDLMLDNDTPVEDIDDEVARADAFAGKYNRLKAKIDNLNKDSLSELSASSQKRNVKLPLIELKKFDGEIENWLPFWAQFKRIHEDQTIENADKFQYLIQATSIKSRARQLVESYPPTDENYPKVIESLKSRFGRDDLLVEFYVRQLLKLVLSNLKSKSKLGNLYDQIESQLRSLETLGITSDKCAAMLFPLVESCLPEETLRVWHRSTNYDARSSLKSRLDFLMEFLQKEVDNEERISLAMSGFDSDKKKKDCQAKFSIIPTASGLFNNNKKVKCVFCKNSHSPIDCNDSIMKNMTFDDKRKILINTGRCYLCLKFGHIAKRCKVDIKCSICGEKHASIMCKNISNSTGSNNLNVNFTSTTVDNLSNTTYHDATFLQTLVVLVSSDSKCRPVRAIIDTGSQRSYIVKHTACEMGYQPVGSEQLIHALFGGANSESIIHYRYKVTLKNLNENYICDFEALDQPLICSNVISIRDGPWKDELSELGIPITDTRDGPIEILIGSDIAGKLFTGKRHSLKCGLVAMETRLGWILMGKPTKTYSEHSGTSSMFVSSLFCMNEISRLWELETLGILDPEKQKTKNEAETDIMNKFLESVRVNSEGRYEVGLTWIDGHPPLHNNFDMAKKRLENLRKKLEKDGYFDSYDEILHEWVRDGIIEELGPNYNEREGFYLPHRHVVKLSSSTTKLRPVFDASARDRNQPSLNQCLDKGINFIELIPSILIRFRLHRIGVVSDIRKAFLQISLQSADRDFLRFLWIDRKGTLKLFRHARVVFGVTSSPFLLAAVIRYHLKNALCQAENNSTFSRWVILKLINSFYVDNCVTSVNNEEELQQFISESSQLMSQGKFDLRGWEYTLTRKEIMYDEENLTPILGLNWNRQADTLQINLGPFEKIDMESITKRAILSFSHRLFDPIGFCCPVLILPRSILQRSWEMKLKWDEDVPAEMKHNFLQWLMELQFLSQIRIPRWLTGKDSTEYSLHMFCDGSRDAYASVIFLKSESASGCHLRFIQAKNRMSPMKKLTIPRLELLAATIGARLLSSILNNFEIKDIPVYCWTDSTTVLSWIQREDYWKPFVWNRTQEIRSLIDKSRWFHVPGHMNPADLPSRGCSPKKLIESRWWEGPEWLKNKAEWPKQTFQLNENEICEEKRKQTDILLNITRDFSAFYHYFSKYRMVVNQMAWIIRFIFNCQNSEARRKGKLSLDEIETAETNLLRLIQLESFKSTEDPNLQSLCPFTDENGIMRIKTKISQREDTYDFLFPILLPSKHPVTEKIIMHYHLEALHIGVQGTLSRLREKFWIPKGRKTVKGILRKCIICQRFDVKKLDAESVPLPKDRVRDAAVFEIIGIDIAGPLFLRSKEKVWICIFTCAIYRAIHLEIVSNSSTDMFLLALRRFIARRGTPSVIYSDNAKNFVGANNLLKAIDWDKVEQEGISQRIKWKFNPPGAPWWGGWWERLIGIVKKLLRKQLGKACLTYEELYSVLCHCESVINSRPLTYISDDKDELAVLTPSMFLQDIKEYGMPCLDEIDGKSLRRHMRYVQKIRLSLRKRFRDEYLSQLIIHSRKHSFKDIKVGDIVIIENENLKRLDWPLGIVEETFPGKDGKVRVVKIKTSTGILMRPIQRLYPLEVDMITNSNVRCDIIKQLPRKSLDKHPDNERDPNPNLKSITSKENDSMHEDVIPITNRSKSPIVTRYGREVKRPTRLGF